MEEKDYSVGLGTVALAFFLIIGAVGLILVSTEISMFFAGVLLTFSLLLIGITVYCLCCYIELRREKKKSKEKKADLEEMKKWLMNYLEWRETPTAPAKDTQESRRKKK